MCNFSLSSYAAIFLQFLSGNILNEYKWDKQNIVGLFYKLTDAHLSPAVQSAMKVTLAAQMTDHTVETSLNATLGGRRIVKTTQLIRKKVFIPICINYMFQPTVAIIRFITDLRGSHISGWGY